MGFRVLLVSDSSAAYKAEGKWLEIERKQNYPVVEGVKKKPCLSMNVYYQNNVDCQSEDYKNNIFTQKLHHISEVPPISETVSDSEVRAKKTELPQKVALDQHNEKGKQISLAWFASQVDKWKDCSRIPVIIICGLILLSFILATAAFVMALHRCFPTCLDGWKHFNKKCYNFSSGKKAWNDSRKLCQLEGADLAVINHEEEQDFLVYMMSSKESHSIGLSDLEKEEIWKWVDGTLPTFKNWYTGELNNWNNENENCAVLQKDFNFMWNDVPCDYEYRYICEKNVQLACVWQSIHISH